MKVRLLTYNIHKAIGVDRRFAPERIIEILRHYDAHVVLLQEVDRGAPRSDHLDLASHIARALEYPYRATGMNVYLKKGRYGNATLSRFPIGQQRNIDLTIAWRKPRGAQHTRIHFPQWHHAALDVFNLHLGLSAGERHRQMQRLLTCSDVTHLRETQPCVIAGDMNDWRGLLRKRHFLPAGFHCATNHENGHSRWSIKTYPSFAPTGGLDKVFFRGPLRLLHAARAHLKLARVASDHLPVIVEFELRPPAAEVEGGKKQTTG